LPRSRLASVNGRSAGNETENRRPAVIAAKRRSILCKKAVVAAIQIFQYTDESDAMKPDRQITNLVITGFSGSGKSVVAKEVARRLSWDFVDTDDEIVKQAGKPIAQIFGQEGEARFRELERDTIKKACRRRRTVVAIGGGAIVDPQNYESLGRTGLIVCLEAKPETIYDRLFREAACSPGTEVRPLLTVDNPLERIRQLKASRQSHYAKSDWTIHTDFLSITEVTEEVVRAWRLLGRSAFVKTTRNAGLIVGNTPSAIARHEMPKQSHKQSASRLPRSARDDTRKADRGGSDKDVACIVETATQSYPIFVGYGMLDKLGEKTKEAALSGTTTIISDENVFPVYGSRVEGVLKDAGFAVNYFVVPAGEETKSTDFATKIYDFLVEHRTERDDIIVALGGGVVGDLAGFAAATFLRGIPWVQVPTSLAAMVDASIGGKVGVNHPEGKNLIGAFYQPTLVLSDPQTLATLPRRELTSGWAEVIKHGLILDREFFEFLENNVDKVKKLDPQLLTAAVARSAAIKAGVVSEDEKERTGKRTILNYGHTIGHGLEAVTEYRRFLHGEAVAIGMMGAAALSQRLGLLSSTAVQRQKSLLQKFDLPASLRAQATSLGRGRKQDNFKVRVAAVASAMKLDKKVRGKAIRWVLLQDIGKTVIRRDVPQQDVLAVLQELIEP
jgi:3-dehydroquinate synthase